MEHIELAQWKVMGSLPYQADFSPHITAGVLINPPTHLVPWIDAQVPGSVYRDLQRAGWIDDPYFDRNSLACEWVAGRWWTYRTAFTVTEAQLQKTFGEHSHIDEACYKVNVENPSDGIMHNVVKAAVHKIYLDRQIELLKNTVLSDTSKQQP